MLVDHLPGVVVVALMEDLLPGDVHHRAARQDVEQCRFTIDTPLCDGQRFAVTWTMHWSHPRIAGQQGKMLVDHLPGVVVVALMEDLLPGDVHHRAARLCDGQRFAVTWTMHWSHPRIAGGETLALPGCSVAPRTAQPSRGRCS
jgi:xanthosine utilization system XapX-like protein